ncbi:MAG: PD-(D/E)XK nuclease family protein, partial [Dorea sp.]|nr:PD-(D/E)XK nuclease family protein [Dorea sp.]
YSILVYESGYVVNKIFERIMIRDLGGIRYDQDAALYPGASYLPAHDLQTELLLFDEDSADGIECSPKELEAHMIASRIRELKQSHLVQDKKTGELRPVKNSDIVILSRSLSGFDEVLNEVLTREGIPVFVGTRSGYFSAYEVGVMLDYLKVLNNRKQDLALAAVLTSPFGLMTEEELASIKIAGGRLPFWKAVEMILAGEIPLEQLSVKEKLTRVFQSLDHYREIVPYTPMHDLLQQIYDETGYMDYVSAMPAGSQRAANLEMLLEKARTFESTSYKGLFHFIRYIDQLQKYEVDYGEASTEDEQSDTVRIMTTHKSKGLEFPIVFVAGMGKRFNFMDARASVVLHSVFGIGLDAMNLEDHTKRASIVKKMIQREEELETRGEELRILYVALTRAKEKLIMTGTMKNIEKKLGDLAAVMPNEDQTLPYSSLSFANSYLDWVLPAIWTEDDPLYLKRIVDAGEVFTDSLQSIVKERVTKEVLLAWGQKEEEAKKESSPYQTAFDQQFAYHYPYEASKNQKLKFTVTELKKREHLLKSMGDAMEEEESELLVKEPPMVPLIPDFMAEKEELTGASRGTAYHRFLELFDYQMDPAAMTAADVEACKKAFVDKGQMSEEMGSCISAQDVLRFFHTKAAERMHQAAIRKELFKEQPFVLGIEADSIYPEAEKEDLVLVQGVIDVYFEEEDGFVVLDYKTDKVRHAGELVDRYKAQLDYYGRALEQMRGKKVKEKMIYSVTLGKEILLKS